VKFSHKLAPGIIGSVYCPDLIGSKKAEGKVLKNGAIFFPQSKTCHKRVK